MRILHFFVVSSPLFIREYIISTVYGLAHVDIFKERSFARPKYYFLCLYSMSRLISVTEKIWRVRIPYLFVDIHPTLFKKKTPMTPACTLCVWTFRHSIRYYSSLKHLALELRHSIRYYSTLKHLAFELNAHFLVFSVTSSTSQFFSTHVLENTYRHM